MKSDTRHRAALADPSIKLDGSNLLITHKQTANAHTLPSSTYTRMHRNSMHRNIINTTPPHTDQTNCHTTRGKRQQILKQHQPARKETTKTRRLRQTTTAPQKMIGSQLRLAAVVVAIACVFAGVCTADSVVQDGDNAHVTMQYEAVCAALDNYLPCDAERGPAGFGMFQGGMNMGGYTTSNRVWTLFDTPQRVRPNRFLKSSWGWTSFWSNWKAAVSGVNPLWGTVASHSISKITSLEQGTMGACALLRVPRRVTHVQLFFVVCFLSTSNLRAHILKSHVRPHSLRSYSTDTFTIDALSQSHGEPLYPESVAVLDNVKLSSSDVEDTAGKYVKRTFSGSYGRVWLYVPRVLCVTSFVLFQTVHTNFTIHVQTTDIFLQRASCARRVVLSALVQKQARAHRHKHTHKTHTNFTLYTYAPINSSARVVCPVPGFLLACSETCGSTRAQSWLRESRCTVCSEKGPVKMARAVRSRCRGLQLSL
jgi:hypothetical protein